MDNPVKLLETYQNEMEKLHSINIIENINTQSSIKIEMQYLFLSHDYPLHSILYSLVFIIGLIFYQ
jgi:hypothetical protein